MKLSNLTSIGFCANMAIDHKKPFSFTFADLYDATEKAQLVPLLQRTIDDSGVIELWARDVPTRTVVERALADAAEALYGREMRKVGIGENPYCMIIAIVFEAIQQNFN